MVVIEVVEGLVEHHEVAEGGAEVSCLHDTFRGAFLEDRSSII